MMHGPINLRFVSIVWYKEINPQTIGLYLTIEEKFGTRHRRIVNCQLICINELDWCVYVGCTGKGIAN